MVEFLRVRERHKSSAFSTEKQGASYTTGAPDPTVPVTPEIRKIRRIISFKRLFTPFSQ